jgi:hypothetical protein
MSNPLVFLITNYEGHVRGTALELWHLRSFCLASRKSVRLTGKLTRNTQARQCTYSVTLWRVRVTIIATGYVPFLLFLA